MQYAQYRDGYRTGIEPVLLAACVPARAGERVIEAGSGAGAGLLCLAFRVPGSTGLGVELDARLAALAQHNAAANGWGERLRFAASGIEDLAPAPGSFDHAIANPPWHDPAGSASPDPGRTAAKRADPGLLDRWTGALAAWLRPRGTLSLIVPAASLETAVAAVTARGLGSLRIVPFWPRAGREAKLVVLQAVRGGRAPTRLSAGLVLHEGGGYTPEATRVLRGAGALPTHTGRPGA